MCGSGGVGKTTTAAAMAVQAATRDRRPCARAHRRSGAPAGRRARRRRDRQRGAAGAAEAFAASGVEPRGELWAAMLDTKAGWDELIRRHAPNAAVRASVLANPLYQNITGRFVHSHDYLAMDQLHELHASGRFDLIIVDTPPSRNALDVLDAPGPDEGVLRLAAAEVADAAVPVAAVHGGVEALLPSRRSGPRLAVPAGHRRVLHPVPGDGAGIRLPRPRGRAGAGRPAHHVRRGVDAGSGPDPRGVVPRAGAARPRHAPRGDRRQPGAPGGDHLEGVRHERPQAGRARQARPCSGWRRRSSADPTSSAGCCARSPTQFHDTAMVATRESERCAELAALAPLLVVDPVARR